MSGLRDQRILIYKVIISRFFAEGNFKNKNTPSIRFEVHQDYHTASHHEPGGFGVKKSMQK